MDNFNIKDMQDAEALLLKNKQLCTQLEEIASLNNQLKKNEAEKKEQYEILDSLAEIFYSMHVIDLINDTVKEYNAKNEVKKIVNHTNGATEMMNQVIDSVIKSESLDEALAFTDLKTVSERLTGKKIISKELIGKNIGWFLASFILMEKDKNGKPSKVIFTTRVIDEEKKQEEKLIRKTQTDEMTGLFNRRAYEEDIYAHNDIPDEENFIYISIDVNGLKVINDSVGHTAGDELIIGSCECMKKSLGAYGKLYRIGGDEFVAILLCSADKIKSVLEDFDKTIASWKGKIIDSLSVSYGWVSKEEVPEASVRQLGVIAEKRMYEAKSAHYRKSGVDRKGQQDAHKALCELYTKILKINITEDTYHIVNMGVDEKTMDKGFSDKISSWFESFGKKGFVHPEDLDEYLRLTDIDYMKDYFKKDKTSLHIFYKRKFGDNEYKQVMMEIIKANDYSDDNQSLFLYVKNIDR